MSRAITFLLLIVAVVTISAYPQTKCGENEFFNSCGSSCPNTCDQPVPPVCTLACVIGCDCIDGYVRNAQDKCVLLQNC
ncbi:chymotrypsin inhibitor-like [Harpegnathos saltator]|uniref:chymotrypsin inhibitor-like n=1 Tax=Harpegnathos saltator TaxID=610380 RepID=UPI00058CA0DE|nr:chymotrypsin inhibitor-like [Harpegnathos saltator]